MKQNEIFIYSNELLTDIFILVDDKDTTSSQDEIESNEIAYSISHSVSDELIPFSDGPQISR